MFILLLSVHTFFAVENAQPLRSLQQGRGSLLNITRSTAKRTNDADSVYFSDLTSKCSNSYDPDCINQVLTAYIDEACDATETTSAEKADCKSYLKSALRSCISANEDEEDLHSCAHWTVEWISPSSLYDDKCEYDEEDDETAIEDVESIPSEYIAYFSLDATFCSCIKGITTYAQYKQCRYAYEHYGCLTAPPYYYYSQKKINRDVPIQYECSYGGSTIEGQTLNASTGDGPVNSYATRVNIVKCTFTGYASPAVVANRSRDYGESDGSLGLGNCAFEKCHFSTDSLIETEVPTVIAHCKFDQCTGGASIVSIFYSDSSSISNTNFTDCTVPGGTAATIYVYLSPTGKFTITRCYFNNTVATSSSPACIYCNITADELIDPATSKRTLFVSSVEISHVGFEGSSVPAVLSASNVESGIDASVFTHDSLTQEVLTSHVTVSEVYTTQEASAALSIAGTLSSTGVTKAAAAEILSKSGATVDAGISLPSTSTAPPSDDSDDGFPTWAIIVIVVAVVVIVAVVVAVVIVLMRRKKGESASDGKSVEVSSDETETEMQ